MKLAATVTVDRQVLLLDLDKVDNVLHTLQDAVHGCIQAVDVVGGMSIYLNEDGKILALPRNSVATNYFDDTYGKGQDVIVGDVVFTGLPDSNGDITSITSTQLQDIIDRAGARA